MKPMTNRTDSPRTSLDSQFTTSPGGRRGRQKKASCCGQPGLRRKLHCSPFLKETIHPTSLKEVPNYFFSCIHRGQHNVIRSAWFYFWRLLGTPVGQGKTAQGLALVVGKAPQGVQVSCWNGTPAREAFLLWVVTEVSTTANKIKHNKIHIQVATATCKW